MSEHLTETSNSSAVTRDLTKEKSLAAVWRAAWVIPSRKSWMAVAGACAIAAGLADPLVDVPSVIAREKLRSLVELGINTTSAVLGFLIAGFTVYSTMTRAEIFKQMAFVRHEQTGLSYLKYNMFSFVKFFVAYCTFFIWCIALRALVVPDGPILALVTMNGLPQVGSITTFVSVLTGISVGGMVYVSLLMPSFIFNIYHSVMTTVRWDIEDDDESTSS